MYFGMSGSLNEWGNGVGLWTLGIERLSKRLRRDIYLSSFYRVRGWVGKFLLVFFCVGCYCVNN